MAAEAEGSEGERGRKARERRTEEQAKHRQRSGRTEAHNFKAHLDILARLGPETPTLQMQQMKRCNDVHLTFCQKWIMKVQEFSSKKTEWRN